jgi:lipopolysaccharide export system permease protein
MTVLDRYLLFLFLRTFLVCFLSFSGLFVVIHLFTNLDEMVRIKELEGVWGAAIGFYGPRIAEIFDKSAAVWALLGAAFSISLMQRRRELTAIESIGISKTRILRPIVHATLLIILLAALNRELVLPSVRNQLVRTAQNWENKDQLPMDLYHDLSTGIKIRGARLSLSEMRIQMVEIQLPNGSEHPVSHISAESGVIHRGKEGQADGLWLSNVTLPAKLDGFRSQSSSGVQIYWPADTHWLKEGECYVVCQYDAYQAAYGKQVLGYLSIHEMMQELRKPRVWYGNRTQINLHARLIQPLLDFSLLLLGIPMIMRRAEKNLFISAGLCFAVIVLFFGVTLASHFLGEYSLIESASMAAWLPAILFTPLAVANYRGLDH